MCTLFKLSCHIIRIWIMERDRARDLYHFTALIEVAKSWALLHVIVKGHGKVPYQSLWLKSVAYGVYPCIAQCYYVVQCVVQTQRERSIHVVPSGQRGEHKIMGFNGMVTCCPPPSRRWSHGGHTSGRNLMRGFLRTRHLLPSLPPLTSEISYTCIHTYSTN